MPVARLRSVDDPPLVAAVAHLRHPARRSARGHRAGGERRRGRRGKRHQRRGSRRREHHRPPRGRCRSRRCCSSRGCGRRGGWGRGGRGRGGGRRGHRRRHLHPRLRRLVHDQALVELGRREVGGVDRAADAPPSGDRLLGRTRWSRRSRLDAHPLVGVVVVDFVPDGDRIVLLDVVVHREEGDLVALVRAGEVAALARLRRPHPRRRGGLLSQGRRRLRGCRRPGSEGRRPLRRAREARRRSLRPVEARPLDVAARLLRGGRVGDRRRPLNLDRFRRRSRRPRGTRRTVHRTRLARRGRRRGRVSRRLDRGRAALLRVHRHVRAHLLARGGRLHVLRPAPTVGVVVDAAGAEHEPVHAHAQVLALGLQALPDEHADAALVRDLAPTGGNVETVWKRVRH